MQIEFLRKIIDQKGGLSTEELGKFVLSFIPESCDDCIWVEEDKKASCPFPGGAPCKIYLNKVLNYLEIKGLI